ncbi:MAG: DUF2235 domain-containing protein [Ectothiorhodospiraceae bacterium]|nr:DUF2235 domain-containing protein [Ectothiorhodospiraceae bacterium]
MGKNIIICCDGTGNEYGKNNTNVVNMYAPIIRNTDQMSYYDPGVGTFSIFGRTIGKKFGVVLGNAFGYGLQANIEDAYEYLMNRYEPGDKLFLFGFSRGAFTVRALAGMLHKVGLLQKGSKNLIPYASKIYNIPDNDDIAMGFKATYSHECKPHFIGVWDTVASLGTIYGKKFFNAKTNPDVENYYQAIAIDEKRKKFPISLWDESTRAAHQTIEQVWFTGVHSDVGGSYEQRGLSNITLMWMLAAAENNGLKLHENWQEKIPPNPLDELHESRTNLWKLWPAVTRKIPEGAKIHKSVLTRQKEIENYNPTLPTDYKEVETSVVTTQVK